MQVPHPSFLHLLAVKCNPFSQSNWYPILKMHKKIERERKPFKMIITIKCYGSVYVNIVKLHCFISYEWIMNRSKISCKILKSFFDLINHCILCNISDIERYIAIIFLNCLIPILWMSSVIMLWFHQKRIIKNVRWTSF